MIYIYTHAYNASKALPRAIESILNQTNPDFVWYLCDNGSTDDTRQIILQYAEKDKRIIPELRDLNHLHPDYKGSLLFWLSTLTSLYERGNDDDFFCTLDADDEYKPDFFEKMICFIDENALEVAACGTDFIDAATNVILGQRTLPQDLILDSVEKIDVHFSAYHQFMRPVWGKLYRFSLLKQCDYENYFTNVKISYGLDTLFCMRAFLHAQSAGILAEPLHKYYMSPASISYNFDSKRIVSDQILDDEARGYLLAKAGKISFQNNIFLNSVYFHALKDSLAVLLRSNLSYYDKLHNMYDIFLHKKTKAMLQQGSIFGANPVDEMCIPVVRWLLAQKEYSREDVAKSIAEILMAMCGDLQQWVSRDGLEYIIMKMPEMPEYILQKGYIRILERLQEWFKQHDMDNVSLSELEIFACIALNKPDEEVFALFTSIKKNRPQVSMALDIDTRIHRLIEKYPLLRSVSAGLAIAVPSVIHWVIQNNYVKALDALVTATNVEMNDEDMEVFILLGQTLSAVAESVDNYIFFCKVYVRFLIAQARMNEAYTKLSELEELLPSDEEVSLLRVDLNNALGTLSSNIDDNR